MRKFFDAVTGRTKQREAGAVAKEHARQKLQRLVVSNATGPNSGVVNGVYELTEEDVNDLPMWRKTDGRWFIFFASDRPMLSGAYSFRYKCEKGAHELRGTGEWYIGNAADKDAGRAAGIAWSETVDASTLPTEAQVGVLNSHGWRVQNGTESKLHAASWELRMQSLIHSDSEPQPLLVQVGHHLAPIAFAMTLP